MQFTPQQMAGYKGYGQGVLIGNWSEDLQVMEDKMRLYHMVKTGTLTNANSTLTINVSMSQPAKLAPPTADGFLSFGVPLQILSAETGGVLALDLTPKYSPRLNHAAVSFSSNKQPVARNVWTLQKVADENGDFYSSVKEAQIVHYGQKLKIVNENASSNGFYSLISTLQDAAKSSGRQELSACLGGGNGTVFTVEPSGGAKGSRDGVAVAAGDQVVFIHRGSHAPLAAQLAHRCSTSFGSEFEASCGMVKSQQTRAQSMQTTQPGNFFTFITAPAGTRFEPLPPKFVPDALTRVREKLIERGGRLGFRGFVRTLRVMDNSGDRNLSRSEFRDAMEVYGIPLSSAELDAVFKAFDRNGDGSVSITEFLRTLRGEMNERRVNIVREAYSRLNKDGRGDVELAELIDVYQSNAAKHPDATSGVPHDQLVKEFMSSWGGKNGTITLAQFIDYYNDIAVSIDDDDYFELMVRNSWHISGGSGWAENTTCRRVLVVFEDDTQRVVELTDDLGLRADDAQAILRKLASQGITNVKRFELHM